ncbi:MAG: pilus assembly protein, partial [Lachnospiraceae bacterium]|nr:pilus assembly protein [Lachnospiraceae bacterium]
MKGMKRKRKLAAKTVSASLTVEAALVLPVVLSVFLFFLSFLQILRADQQLYYAASELTEKTAACGYILKYATQEA